MRPTATLGAGLLVVAVIGACGGGSKPSPAAAGVASPSPALPSPTAMSVADQGRAYLAAVAPANTAAGLLNAKIDAKASQAEIAPVAEQTARTFEAVDQALARIAFTGQAATDVRSLITADSQLINDLQSVRKQTAFSSEEFATQFGRDAAALSAAVTLIRADLGLPPSK